MQKFNCVGKHAVVSKNTRKKDRGARSGSSLRVFGEKLGNRSLEIRKPLRCLTRCGITVAAVSDINECYWVQCPPSSFCVNTAGSFYCQCESGFAGSGFNCTKDRSKLLKEISKVNILNN